MSPARSFGLVREQRAQPGRFWIRYRPRRWPGPPECWTDLAGATLGHNEALEEELWEELAALPLDDVLYLPPVAAEHARERDLVAAAHRRRGTPVVLQVLPSDPPPAAADVVVVDLLPLLLGGDEGADTPVGAAVWPLVSGLGSGDETAERMLSLARRRGAHAVQSVPLELDPTERRHLAERLPESFGLELFHGQPPDLRASARRAVAAGFLPIVPRPLPRPPIRGASNLRLAGLLAEAAELCERLGEAPSRGQAFQRGATWAEESGHELAGLAREGNLAILPWLEEEARALIEEAADGGTPEILRRLREGGGISNVE